MSKSSAEALPPLACTECALGKFALYGPTIEKTPREVYTRRRSVMVVAANKTFLREGETLTQIYTLYSGWAFSFLTLPEGRRQILSFFIPGDAVVLEGLCFPGFPLPFSVKSLVPLAVCVFDMKDMLSLMNTAEAQIEKLASVKREHVTDLYTRLADIGRRSALGRVAGLILELEGRMSARKLSTNGHFHFPARQEDIADALGLTTVYVNRTLDRLRRQNVIEFERQWMTVRDFDQLIKIADEE